MRREMGGSMGSEGSVGKGSNVLKREREGE